MKISMCGDLALSGRIGEVALAGEAREIAEGVRERVSGSVAFIGNIECPLTDSEEPAYKHIPTLRASEAVAPFLRELGISVGTLANNHIGDYGRKGLEDTIRALGRVGIEWVGAGLSERDACRPLVIERGGLRIGILALAQSELGAVGKRGYGAGTLREEFAVDSVKKMIKEAEIVLAFLHFGVEFADHPTPRQIGLSRRMIEAGAKMVIGHHSHVAQGFEFYRGGFIAYSLGNFMFDMQDGARRFSGLGTMMIAEFEGKELKGVEIIPVDTSSGFPRFLLGNERSAAISHLGCLSSTLKEETELRKKYYFVCRDNLYTHLLAFFEYIWVYKNIFRLKVLILSQLWPQIRVMRLDLLKFLFSGFAYEIEHERIPRKSSKPSNLWRGVSCLFWAAGFVWRKFVRGR